MVKPKNSILLLLVFTRSISCTDRNIPSISIEKDSPIEWKTKEPCIIKYSDNHDTLVIPAKIKCRGGVSGKYDKHSSDVDFAKQRISYLDEYFKFKK